MLTCQCHPAAVDAIDAQVNDEPVLQEICAQTVRQDGFMLDEKNARRHVRFCAQV
ncbi:MAG: hypothetical protein Q8L92_15920 [Rubrivivax sp.]|nr:hypothetical protein [Rubrivivax sp.]